MSSRATEHCPCGRARPYSACCEPLHRGTAQAHTAGHLMRSRYAAFCKGYVDYLIATLHPSKRKPDDRAVLQRTIDRHQWLGLQILDTHRGGRADDVGYVEFVAYHSGPAPGQIHDRSRCVKEEGQWFYWGGQHKEPVRTGRNDPCWCGSGKKYKRCHGA